MVVSTCNQAGSDAKNLQDYIDDRHDDGQE